MHHRGARSGSRGCKDVDRRAFLKRIGKFSTVVASVAFLSPWGCDDNGDERDYRDYEDEYDDYTNFYDNYENSYIDFYMEHTYEDSGGHQDYMNAYTDMQFP
jgi:hypothetical protein